MSILIPLNWGTASACWLLMLYILPRIGSKEHKGWLTSNKSLAVALVTILLFCMGMNWPAVAHLFSFMFRG